MKLRVFNIQHFSVNDGPGIRTVVFLKGCPLRCVWCHNPEGISAQSVLSYTDTLCVSCSKCALVCQHDVHSFKDGKHFIDRAKCNLCGKCVDDCLRGALKLVGDEKSTDEILRNIETDRAYYGIDGGVTISGGEPFYQFDALMFLLKRLKKEKYHVCMETTGFTSEDNIKEASKYTDIFLYDYKETSEENHIKYTGVGRKKILDNLYVLDDMGANVILRCPIIPDINDTDEHICGIAEVADAHTCISAINLMPYHPLGIEKRERIGEICQYTRETFADRERIIKISEQLKTLTTKTVEIQ